MKTEAVCGDCGEVDREPSTGSELGSLHLCAGCTDRRLARLPLDECGEMVGRIEARKWRGDEDEEDGEAEEIAQVVGRLIFSDDPVLRGLAVKLAGEFKAGREY